MRGLVLLLLLGGCAFRPQVGGMAIDHNEFVAETANRQTLLNILRAREREPLHFTSFSKVLGSARAAGSLGSGVALNGDGGSVSTSVGASGAATVVETATQGTTNFTPNIGVNISTGTDFEIAINATDDFYKGILGPLATSTIVHFLRQGYPADLLSHLLIGRMEFYAQLTRPDGAVEMALLKSVANSPDDADSARDFGDVMKCRKLGYQFKPGQATTLPVQSLTDLAGVPAEVLARLSVVDKDATAPFRLVTPGRSDYVIALTAPPKDMAGCGASYRMLSGAMQAWMAEQQLTGRAADAMTSTYALYQGLTERAGQIEGAPTARGDTSGLATGISEGISGAGGATFASEGYFTRLLPDGWKGDLVIEMSFRSVEGIFYYLGEYVRDPATSPKLFHRNCDATVNDGYCVPVLRVVPASDMGGLPRFADMDYRGTRYALPLSGASISAQAGRTSQTVALLQQLLNLHRSSKDLPSTPLVRVLN